jgi:uncharacterized membrane-anchored protein
MNHRLPDEYVLRRSLSNEVHSHPYEPLQPPERITYIAMLASESEREAEWRHLRRLCEALGQPMPDGPDERDSLRVDFGIFRLKMERHQEFTRYKFVERADLTLDAPFADPVTRLLPEGWLADLPGKLLVASHIAMLPSQNLDDATLLDRVGGLFDPSSLTGSVVGRSRNRAFTDFHLDADGFSRLLIIANTDLPAQAGRLLLRLLELETYRMLALLALPEARCLLRELPQADARLTELTRFIVESDGKSDEELLDELSGFAAMIENRVSTHYRRFAATRAYFGMVERRLNDLDEEAIPRISPIGNFLMRRLEPARDTCDSVAHWLEQLAGRVSQATGLLRTRVDVRNERQNQELLAAMNTRAGLQLRLQQAAELLSVAIFTYYSTSLIGYMAEELAIDTGWPINVLTVKVIAIPLLAGGALLAIRRSRKRILAAESEMPASK